MLMEMGTDGTPSRFSMFAPDGISDVIQISVSHDLNWRLSSNVRGAYGGSVCREAAFSHIHYAESGTASPRGWRRTMITEQEEIQSFQFLVSSFFASSTSHEATPSLVQPLALRTYSLNFYIPVNFRNSQLPTVSNNNNPQITPSTPGPESTSPSTFPPIIKGSASWPGGGFAR
jgi:hypothetical protein